MKITPLPLALILFPLWLAIPASAGTTKTIVVNSAASAGPAAVGTLTWAIYQANYQGADLNYINFAIPGVTAEVEIALTETLYLARPTIINATTQPGYAGQPLIRINCTPVGGIPLASGFNIVPAGGGLPGGAGSTIQGFRIINYSSNAITLSRGADGNVIANNQIGFVPVAGTGTFLRNDTLFPACRGLGIQSSGNTIRGNTISGVSNAITLGDDIGAPTGAVYQNNSFERNFIGTDATGMVKIGNNSDGIFFGAGAQQNLIGPGNVISGMDSSGVELLHATATGNRIFGNLIGLNAAGTGVIPNGELGILIANGASDNWVGGPYGGVYAGNVISGNNLGGVVIGTAAFPGGSNNRIEGNLIGTDAAESKALGTQVSGITLESGAAGNTIRKNVIVGQVNHAVVLSDATNNAAYGNWIGITSKGVTIANGAFGFYVLNSSNNIVEVSAASAGVGTEQNIFGSNGLGPVGVNGMSKDNVIDLGSPAPTPTPVPLPGGTPAQLQNISTRMSVGTGDSVLIAGFIVTGPAGSTKKVLIRGMGPTLAKFGVLGTLSDPLLELHAGNVTMATNDSWQQGNLAAIPAGFEPSDPREALLVATLTVGSSGLTNYSAIVKGAHGETGIGIAEVYDLEPTSAAKLANISTRGDVQRGDNVMIAGFILGVGTGQTTVVVRALGASLTAFGVPGALGDTTLKVVDKNGVTVKANDNWHDDAAQAAQLTTLGFAPPDPSDAGVVVTVAPDNYTAIVAGKNGTQGTALVEVYTVP